MTNADGSLREAPAPRGVLTPGGQADPVSHLRVLPPDTLAPFIAHFWTVRWSLASPRVAETLPHPSVHIVFEVSNDEERAEVTGVHTARFERTLRGQGWVFGVKFRPAAFSILGGPRVMSELRDRVVPLEHVFGKDAPAWARATWQAGSLEEQIKLAIDILTPRLSPLPPLAVRTRDLVERMAHDRTLCRTTDAAAALHLNVRTLERAFHRYVGTTPKWVLSRYRLHEAAERLKSSSPPSLATLAAELHYADQAHFARDFRSVIGRTPGAFMAMHAR